MFKYGRFQKWIYGRVYNFPVSIRGSKWVVGRERWQSGMYLPQFRADMDDIGEHNSATYNRLLTESRQKARESR